jgi:hypothetical protein
MNRTAAGLFWLFAIIGTVLIWGYLVINGIENLSNML